MKTSLLALTVAGALAMAASQAQGDVFYALNATGTNISTLDTTAPGTLLLGKAITGLTANEQILAIDSRPAGGGLYGIGSFGNVYLINPVTGGAVNVGNSGSLDGVNFGFDFNPTVDRVRLVSDTGTNFRINPITGAAVLPPDLELAYVAGDPNAGKNPNIVAIGYTNNVPTASTTALFGLDSGLNTLVTFAGNPNAGQLVTVGSLGLDFTSVAGLDISASNVAYAVLEPAAGSVSYLYSINLATGAATQLGLIGGGFEVRDIALALPIPEPASLALLGLAVPALLARRKKA